jgi:hypothetical protein
VGHDLMNESGVVCCMCHDGWGSGFCLSVVIHHAWFNELFSFLEGGKFLYIPTSLPYLSASFHFCRMIPVLLLLSMAFTENG